MIRKKIYVKTQKGVNFSFENYYSLHVNEYKTICKVIIPIYGINSNHSPKVSESVSVKELISHGDIFKIDLSGDVELSIICNLSDIIQISDNMIELVLSIQK